MNFKSFLAIFAVTQLVTGHVAVVKAVGKVDKASSVKSDTDSRPRDGSNRNPIDYD
ncbi:hypothetical protein HI914_03159 [Erysiphe necator]|nr:hypothetical protein HI914_03159 [Erysiphe necator]